MWVTYQGRFRDATKRAFLLSPFEDSFWWFHRVLLQGLTSSRCLWRNKRETSLHLVASPASRSVCGTVASACLPDLQRPWSTPSAMPTYLTRVQEISLCDLSSDGETWLTGDEEVLAEAAATAIGSPIAPRETRSRKRAKGKKSASSGPPSKSRPSVGDKPVPMAVSSKEERSRVTSFHGRICVP